MTFDQFKGLVADLARPFAIYSSSGAAATATILIALQVKTFGEGAFYIGAVWAGVGALYWGKAWELAKAGGHAADVEKVRATANPPPAAALAPAPEAERSLEDPA